MNAMDENLRGMYLRTKNLRTSYVSIYVLIFFVRCEFNLAGEVNENKTLPATSLWPFCLPYSTGGCGKAAHSPRTEKNGDFFGQIFRLRFFYTEPREAWVRSHTSCVNFIFLQMLATFGIFTQVWHIYTSVTIFTQECHIFRHIYTKCYKHSTILCHTQ